MPVAFAAVVGLSLATILASVLWLRPRVSRHRAYALTLAAPGLVFAVAAIAFGGGLITLPLWAAAAICLSAGWAFWPTRDHSWERFQAAFHAHVGEHEST